MATSNKDMITGWVGWAGFASFLLLFAGFFHIIEGVAYLARHSIFVNASGYVWVLNYRTWGWINVVGGILLVTAALTLLKGGLWGRVFASLILVLSMLASAATIPVYPIWSILVLLVDTLILYAVTVHGKELA